MALDRCSVAGCGRTATYKVESKTGNSPTFSGTPDTFFCATHLLEEMAINNKAVKGVALAGEKQKLQKGSTAYNDTFTDSGLPY